MATVLEQARPVAANDAALAQIDKSMVDQIGSRVLGLVGQGKLALPPSYSAENALKQAWLALQSVETSDKRSALAVCTRASIANSLLDMVVQGLSPAKKQCYFIAYGDQLCCQRSYMGAMAVARRIRPEIHDFFSAAVYAADKFRYRILPGGGREVVEHEQALANVDDGNVIGAYACAVGRGTEVLGADGQVVASNGPVLRTEIMTIAEIHRAWRQSRANPFDGNALKPASTQAKFTAEMAQKTVIARLCKRFINASDDSDLFRSTARGERDAEAEELEAEVAANANTGPVVDIQEPVAAAASARMSEADLRERHATAVRQAGERARSAEVAETADDPGF